MQRCKSGECQDIWGIRLRQAGAEGVGKRVGEEWTR